MKIKDKSQDKDVYIPPQTFEEVYEPEVPQVDKDLVELHNLLKEVDRDEAH